MQRSWYVEENCENAYRTARQRATYRQNKEAGGHLLNHILFEKEINFAPTPPCDSRHNRGGPGGVCGVSLSPIRGCAQDARGDRSERVSSFLMTFMTGPGTHLRRHGMK